jgi:hypothetical protein
MCLFTNHFSSLGKWQFTPFSHFLFSCFLCWVWEFEYILYKSPLSDMQLGNIFCQFVAFQISLHSKSFYLSKVQFIYISLNVLWILFLYYFMCYKSLALGFRHFLLWFFYIKCEVSVWILLFCFVVFYGWPIAPGLFTKSITLPSVNSLLSTEEFCYI